MPQTVQAVYDGEVLRPATSLGLEPNTPVRLTVEVLSQREMRPTLGMREEDWPMTPEGIAGHLQRMESVQPGWLSPEDDLAWRTALREGRAADKAQFHTTAEKLRGQWE